MNFGKAFCLVNYVVNKKYKVTIQLKF